MASWTMSPGFMVSFRLLEMLFIGAGRPAGWKGEEEKSPPFTWWEKERVSDSTGNKGEQGRSRKECQVENRRWPAWQKKGRADLADQRGAEVIEGASAAREGRGSSEGRERERAWIKEGIRKAEGKHRLE